MDRGFISKGAALVAAAGVALAATTASATTVTFNPAAAGLGGSSFSFDALQGTEVSLIANTFNGDGSLSFVENGYLQVTGIELGDAVSVPTGLNSSYTLYFSFSDTGGAPSLAAPGTVTSANITLYGVNGASTFALNSGGATVANNNTPVALLSLAFTSGTIGSTLVSYPPPVLDLNATLNGIVDPIVAGFLAAPGLPLASVLVATHDHSTVQVLDGGATFLVDGGPDSISFVPAPASAPLLAAGLAGIAAIRVRWRERRSDGRPCSRPK